MLLLLATLVSLAITVPTTKRRLELKYQEKHKVALREEEVLERRRAFRIDDQRGYMMKYWVMAESSSLMARSVVSTTSAVIGLLAAIILAGSYILLFVTIERVSFQQTASDYGWSTIWIQVIQSIGVVVGTIAPALRWFVAVSFNCSMTNRNSFRKGFKIEDHWIQTLVDWRHSFSCLQIWQNKCRKYLHDVKWFALTFCIGVQILIVLIGKLLVFLSALLISRFCLCFTHIKKFVMQHSFRDMISNKQIEHESGDDTDLNLSRYVLLLEGIVMEFKKEVQDPIMENPLNWPAKVVAANTMYRISQTILLSCEEEDEQTNEGLFERLSVMIADILAACFTNLPSVITTMCHCNSIEKREKSVRKAFLFLGKTEQVVEFLQQQEWPSLDHDKAAYIEEWRASTSTSSDEIVITPVFSSEEHLGIMLDC